MPTLSPQELEFADPRPGDKRYDVFISFRGEDTRNGFTDTLYHSLLGSKIYTFIDADLTGYAINALYEKIENSRMAVVVYSERFASSHWCLTELELIMQRWKEKKMMIIPIFYKVDAHEVKHPTRKTTKYFDEHIIKHGRAVVRKWKDVVTKFGNVSGFPYKDSYGSERDFINTQIITKVKKMLRESGETDQESSSSKPYNSGPAAIENNDVFISYFEKDTHYDFVSHLNETLRNYRKEIKIFMVDQDLLKDDNIFDVIQRSKMAVIVFSPNYASSKWCLRELMKILECCNITGQEVLPIFYETNQVINERIAYHLEKHACDEKWEMVQSWRKAIDELSNMDSWRYSTIHSKPGALANFIQRLVGEILTVLKRVDEKKKSSGNQQAHVSSAKEENTQALALQTNVAKSSPRSGMVVGSSSDGSIDASVSVGNCSSEVGVAVVNVNIEEAVSLKRVEKLELSSNDQHQADEVKKELVLTLDHSNFYETITKHAFVVVEFYAPWSDDCKALAPEYEKAASILSSTHPRIILAKFDVNEDANQELANKHAIDGVPTFKIFRDGGKTVHRYNAIHFGDEGIVEYLKKQSGPASVEIKAAEDAIGLIGENSLVIVGVFPKLSGKEYDNFMSLAEKLRPDYDFAHTQDAKLLPRGDTSVSGPLVRVFKPFDQLFVDSMDFNVKALKKFLEESSCPLLTLFINDPRQHPYVIKFFNNQNAKVMLFMNFDNEVAESIKAKYREVSQQFKGHGISFMLVDLEGDQRVFKFLGIIKKEQVPAIAALSNEEHKYLKLNIEVDDIAPWVKDFKDGKLSRFMISEPIPQDNSEPVKVVVADSIDDVVFKSGKNVLIEFYASWCPQCKKLAPMLEEVALSFESDPNIVIAKFEVYANDITTDAFNVNSCHILYFRSSTGTILRYDGDKTKEDINNFIQKNRVSCSIMTSLIEKGASSHQNIDVSPILPQLQQERIGSSTQSIPHSNTTREEEVYRIVTSCSKTPTKAVSRELLHIKPARLNFVVEWQKPSSTSFVMTNTTDSHVAFNIIQSKMQFFTVEPNMGVLMPRTTCQVTVIMKAQSELLQAKDKRLLLRSVKAKNDSASNYDSISAMFKEPSENAIDKWIMFVYYDTPPELVSDSSVPDDYRAQLISKGFIRKSKGVLCTDMHPTKPWVLLSSSCDMVSIWNYETQAKEMSFKVTVLPFEYSKFIPEKHWIVVGCGDGFVHIFDYNTSEKLKEFKAHENFILCMEVHPTSPYLFTTAEGKLIKLWNWKNDWASDQTFEGHLNVTKVAFNPRDSSSFASVSSDGTIKIWSFGSSVAKFTIDAHANYLNCVEYFIGNGNKLYLLSGSADNSARIWDYDSKSLVQTLEGHSKNIMATLVHPVLPIIITGSEDSTIRIWNKITYRLKLVWSCDLGRIWTIGFIKASNEVILGCDDGFLIIKIVEAETPSD